MINLVYLSDNPYGGWVTYTYHLYHALHRAGVACQVVKLGKFSGNRNFGYGLQYARRTVDELRGQHNLIVAVQKNQSEACTALLEDGAAIVAHDPNEFKFIPATCNRIITIRKANQKALAGSVYIPHPYLPRNLQALKKKRAISVSRIDFDKHTEILLDANRLQSGMIDIRGFENRIYTRFKIMPKYPEWQQSKAAFPRDAGAAVDLLLPYRYMVDMSVIKGDGGGTQYTFLEAIDAGCCVVINKEWVLPKGVMQPGVNCLAVADAAELKKVLMKTPVKTASAIADRARALLKVHDYVKIGEVYRKFFQSCGWR